MSLRVLSIGPAVALQDLGRPGLIAQGLTQGGAADRLAIFEGAALLDQPPNSAVLEMVGLGGTFRAETDTVIALTGAAMRAAIEGRAVAWNASHALASGQVLEIGPSLDGTYGYLHVAGGFDAPERMGGRGAHLSVGLGHLVAAGDLLATLDGAGRPDFVLPRDDRFSGGALRIMPSMQTHLFSEEMRVRLCAESFLRDPRADRQGIRLTHDGEAFGAVGGLSVLSEIAVPGDVQISGSGDPFILLCESQTTAGYPRIATVLPSDVPKAAQCPAGGALRFEWITHEAAREMEGRARAAREKLFDQCTPRLRTPEQIDNLRDFNLISGAIWGE